MAEPVSLPYGDLSLGGVAIPAAARLRWSQTRRTLDSAYKLEYSDLSAEIQQGTTSATKQLITLSCEGWMPPGIDALARTSTHSFTFEKPSAENTWTTTTLTVLIWERAQYTDDPSDPGGGSVRWSLTLREA